MTTNSNQSSMRGSVGVTASCKEVRKKNELLLLAHVYPFCFHPIVQHGDSTVSGRRETDCGREPSGNAELSGNVEPSGRYQPPEGSTMNPSALNLVPSGPIGTPSRSTGRPSGPTYTPFSFAKVPAQELEFKNTGLSVYVNVFAPSETNSMFKT
jgi:hypothetical protein